ncbi:hypothetical protein P7F88_06400 [Vibrio hannami]|uniref:CHASE3 domain-containing protein n=1 Tax=Vibrio hannami TaxID=2717094 RepID=UPI00240F457E|nr:hypothetical protein [Vibrio hannami]MDG3085750.1 hypothetical protein [Vibrio hannami]
MNIKNWSLTKKLRTNLLLYLICFSLLMIAAISGFSKSQKLFNDVAHDTVPDIVAILELKSISKRLFAEIQGFVATGDVDEMEEFAESLELFDVWLERWVIHDSDTAELELKQAMSNHKKAFETFANEIFSLAAEEEKLVDEFSEMFDELSYLKNSLSIEPSDVISKNRIDDLITNLKIFYVQTYSSLLTILEGEEEEESNLERELFKNSIRDLSNHIGINALVIIADKILLTSDK